MVASIVFFCLKHFLFPIGTYLVVQGSAIAYDVDATISTAIAGASAFGSLIVSFKFGG